MGWEMLRRKQRLPGQRKGQGCCSADPCGAGAAGGGGGHGTSTGHEHRGDGRR